jgi:hypothetical protein
MTGLSPRLARMAARVGGLRGFHYTIHIAEDPAFVFFSNPICACSTLKATLNMSVARRQGRDDFRIASAEAIHDRRANLLKTPQDIGHDRFEAMLDDPGVTKFAFVRRAESRFLSAFRKKLSHETAFTRRVRAYLGVDAQVPLAGFLTPDRFAAGVAADPGLRDLDEHWRLQRSQIFFDDVPDLQIGFVEDFAADAARILGAIFGPDGVVMQDAVEINPANTSASRAELALSDAGRADVARAYAADLGMLATCHLRRKVLAALQDKT